MSVNALGPSKMLSMLCDRLGNVKHQVFVVENLERMVLNEIRSWSKLSVIKHGIIGIVEEKCKFSDKNNPTTRIRNSLTARPLLVNHKKHNFQMGDSWPEPQRAVKDEVMSKLNFAEYVIV